MDDGSDALRSSAERRHRPERHRFGVRNRMNQRSRSPSTDGVEMGPHAMSPHDRSALMTPKFASVVDRITTTEPPHQLSRERRRGGSSPPEFNFGDQNQGPLIEDQPRDSKKYMSSKGSGQGIKPGAAIMGSEEAHLLRERFMPPTESSRFLSNILSKKRKAAANPKLQTDKKKLSLESMSAPRGSPHSSSPVKTTTQQARMTEWRTTRATSASKAADAVSSEKPRPRGRVSLDRSGTLAPAIGAIGDRVARRSSLTPPTRVSPRLKQNSPDWKKPSPSSSKKEIGQGSINFITRRSTRAQNAKKAKNKDGTADMPINLDSDSESEYERVDNSNGINPADEERAAIVEMKDVEVWIGPFECRADVFFNKEAMAICSIRGVPARWTGKANYLVHYLLLMDVHVCRPRKTESDEAFTPRAAYMAMACELNDDSLRKFYNPAGKDQSKRYVVIFAKDKRAEEFATVESLLKTEIYDPVQLIKKSQRLDFLRALRLEQSPPDVEGTGAVPRTRSATSRDFVASAEENASSKKEKVTDTQLTYPLPPCSSDIVTITTQDVARLQPERYFNDNLIDYYFKRIMLEDFKAQPRIQKNVLFLSSHFYSQLRLGKGSTPIDRVKAGYKNVSTWLARSDFFNRSMVFIPINKDLHWSLAIIINPRAAAEDWDDDDGDAPMTCIALLDPLGNYHNKATLLKQLRCFLGLEWEKCGAGKATNEEYDQDKVHALYVKAPQQQNSFDCGVFILKYAEVILKNYLTLKDGDEDTDDPTMPISREVTDNKLELLIPSEAFDASDVDAKRRQVLEHIEQDTRRYDACPPIRIHVLNSSNVT